MATRNVTGAQVRQSMVTSGSAVKSRQLVSVPCPISTVSVIVLYLSDRHDEFITSFPTFIEWGQMF
jgi:3-polyprenyl-4-hydroxybenzoate decarboxylase